MEGKSFNINFRKQPSENKDQGGRGFFAKISKYVQSDEAKLGKVEAGWL